MVAGTKKIIRRDVEKLAPSYAANRDLQMLQLLWKIAKLFIEIEIYRNRKHPVGEDSMNSSSQFNL